MAEKSTAPLIFDWDFLLFASANTVFCLKTTMHQQCAWPQPATGTQVCSLHRLGKVQSWLPRYEHTVCLSVQSVSWDQLGFSVPLMPSEYGMWVINQRNWGEKNVLPRLNRWSFALMFSMMSWKQGFIHHVVKWNVFAGIQYPKTEKLYACVEKRGAVTCCRLSVSLWFILFEHHQVLTFMMAFIEILRLLKWLCVIHHPLGILAGTHIFFSAFLQMIILSMRLYIQFKYMFYLFNRCDCLK